MSMFVAAPRSGRILLSLSILIGAVCSCRGEIPAAEQARAEALAGCWRGGMVRDGTVEDAELRLLSVRPDGGLSLTLSYELGPRSRVRTYDLAIDLEGEGREISWLAHSGFVDETGDTMRVTKEWKGEESSWVFTRDRDSDLFLRTLVAAGGSEWTYRRPEVREDGWACNDLTSSALDPAPIVRLMEEIRKGRHGDIHSIVIASNGKLVLDAYFAADGSLSGTFIADTFRDRPHHLASVTKAVTSALVGIAIDEGLIDGVDDRVLSLMPEYTSLRTEDKARIEVRHLLTMTAGFQWQQFRYPFTDARNDAGEMYRVDDVIGFILSRPMDSEPGDKFNYSNGVATLAGEVVSRASGMDVDAFARDKLFEPMGISDYVWTRYPDGTVDSDGGLALRPRDLAKLGQLFLGGGIWEEHEVISTEWIRESTRGRVRLSNERSFGYYWNQMKLDVNGKETLAFFAPGDGGQFLAVVPALDIVFVATAGNYGSDPTKTYWKLIREHVIPAAAP